MFNGCKKIITPLVSMFSKLLTKINQGKMCAEHPDGGIADLVRVMFSSPT